MWHPDGYACETESTRGPGLVIFSRVMPGMVVGGMLDHVDVSPSGQATVNSSMVAAPPRPKCAIGGPPLPDPCRLRIHRVCCCSPIRMVTIEPMPCGFCPGCVSLTVTEPACERG